MNEVIVSVCTAPVDCWACGAEFSIVSSLQLSGGERRVECRVSDFTEFPCLMEEIQADLPGDMRIGALKMQESKTWARYYMSNGCYHCDTLFGDHYEIHARYGESIAVVFSGEALDKWSRMANMLEQSDDGHPV